MLSPLELLSYKYIYISYKYIYISYKFTKSDNYLQHFLCHMTSDVKFLPIFKFTFSLFKGRSILWIKVTWAI